MDARYVAMPCSYQQEDLLCCELLCRIAPVQRAPPALPGRRAAVDLTSSRVPAADTIKQQLPLPFHFLAGGTCVTCTARGKSGGPKPGAGGSDIQHGPQHALAAGRRAAGRRGRPRLRGGDQTEPLRHSSWTACARRAHVRHSSSGCCGRQHGSTTARRRTCARFLFLWSPNLQPIS